MSTFKNLPQIAASNQAVLDFARIINEVEMLTSFVDEYKRPAAQVELLKRHLLLEIESSHALLNRQNSRQL